MNSGPIPFAWELIWMSAGAGAMYIDGRLYIAAGSLLFFGGLVVTVANHESEQT